MDMAEELYLTRYDMMKKKGSKKVKQFQWSFLFFLSNQARLALKTCAALPQVEEWYANASKVHVLAQQVLHPCRRV